MLALLGGGGWYFLRQQKSPPPPHAVATAAAAPVEIPKAEAPQPREATIVLRASPAEAKLFLDDRELPSNPASEVLPIDGKLHHVRAEAEGFVSESVELSPTRDDSIVLTLKPAPASAKRVVSRRAVVTGKQAAPVASGKQVATASSAPAVQKKPACDQPFFLDSDGIKKIRPECL